MGTFPYREIMKTKEIVIKNLKNLRESNGFKQDEIALFLGITKDTYWRWENGKSSIPYEGLDKLAETFKISVSGFFKTDPIERTGKQMADELKAIAAVNYLNGYFQINEDESEIIRIENNIIAASESFELNSKDLKFYMSKLIMESTQNINRCALLNKKDMDSGWTWKITAFPDYYLKWRKLHAPELKRPLR